MTNSDFLRELETLSRAANHADRATASWVRELIEQAAEFWAHGHDTAAEMYINQAKQELLACVS